MPIPASAIASVIPGVISAGGQGLVLNGVALSANSRLPQGQAVTFANQAAVGSYFGTSSTEYALAGNYFAGYNGAPQLPGNLIFWAYAFSGPTFAFLRGTTLAGTSLTQLQAITGNLSIVVDAMTRSAASVNLSSASSFSAAAATLQTELNATPVTASCTAGSIAGFVLTVGGTVTGTFYTGMVITGTGISGTCIITGYLTGSGGTGTYSVSTTQTVAAETITGTSVNVVVTYDSVTQAFVVTSGTSGPVSTIAAATGTAAAALGLSTGATLSQGVVQATPAAAMNALMTATQNWACFATVFEPVLADKESFALWTSQQGKRYAYICWDTDSNASVAGNTTCFGYNITQLGYNGTYAISGDPSYAASQGTTLAALLPPVAFFNLGVAACLNFSKKNGSTTYAFLTQPGLAFSVGSQTIGNNLIANGYNFYGQYATPNETFVWNYPGQVSGVFDWMNQYVEQIWLNSQLQLSMMELYQNTPKIPYNNQGYGLIRQGLIPDFTAAVYYGAIETGVELSAAEIAEVNAQAGLDISVPLFNQGYYLQVLDPGATVRRASGSPVMNAWYTSGGAVQQMTLASIDVQ